MNITIINDCKDDNAKARQLARVSSILKYPTNFIGVSNELEASGNIIDTLDANQNSAGIILVNVAPRNGKAKKHINGTPFGYFWYKKTLVVSSIDGLTLSLVKKLGVTAYINVLDIPQTLEILIKNKKLPQNLKYHIVNSQFRSYEYLPRIATFIFKNKKIKNKQININTIADAPSAIWWIDNFGNCKTTILLEELNNRKLSIHRKKLKYFARMKDVPNKKPGIIIGSSGLNEKRFLEIVIQGDNAAKNFSLSSGEKF